MGGKRANELIHRTKSIQYISLVSSSETLSLMPMMQMSGFSYKSLD